MTTQAPSQLTSVAAQVGDRLDELLAAESARWAGVDPRLAEAVDELATTLTGGGKRLRAAFCYWGWRGRCSGPGDPCDGRGERTVLDAAAAFELLQAFALIHDDVMDDSDTRRGLPTVHVRQADRLVEEGWTGEPRRFGEGVAILVGDLGHAYADRLMADVDPAARRIWDELRIELSLGQYLDLRSAAAADLDRATADRVSTFKSALYTIVRPLQLGASLDGPVDDEVLDLLEAYGRPLGRAFQLKDDLLGVLGDEATIGKPVGDDLREGKPTELVALGRQRADAAQARVLAGIGRRDLTEADVADIVAVLDATGAVAETMEAIDGLVVTAVDAAHALPFGAEAREALIALATYVAARTS